MAQSPYTSRAVFEALPALQQVLLALQGHLTEYGVAGLPVRQGAWPPLALERASDGNAFRHGALAALADVAQLVLSTDEGRQALADLRLQGFLEEFERE